LTNSQNTHDICQVLFGCSVAISCLCKRGRPRYTNNFKQTLDKLKRHRNVIKGISVHVLALAQDTRVGLFQTTASHRNPSRHGAGVFQPSCSTTKIQGINVRHVIICNEPSCQSCRRFFKATNKHTHLQEAFDHYAAMQSTQMPSLSLTTLVSRPCMPYGRTAAAIHEVEACHSDLFGSCGCVDTEVCTDIFALCLCRTISPCSSNRLLGGKIC